MKSIRLFSILAMAAGLFVSCGEKDAPDIRGHEASLSVSPKSQKISAAGTAAFTFTFSFSDADGRAVADISKYTATVSFTATGGSVSPASATTDERGEITVTFTASDPASFKGGTVKGVIKKVEENVADGLFQQGDLASATATVLAVDAEEPVSEIMKKAQKLKDNVYVVAKKGGSTKDYTIYPGESSWHVGTNTDALSFTLADEVPTGENDPEGNPYLTTNGWGQFVLPAACVGNLQTFTKAFFKQYPWAEVMFGNYDESWMTQASSMISVKTGTSSDGSIWGNLNLNGSSQFLIQEKAKVKSYEGQYEVFFALLFNNQEYNPNTGDEVLGAEYSIYGHAVIDQVVPTLDNISLSADKNFVKPNESASLSVDYTDGAAFDWSKLQLGKQYRGNTEGTWFSYDATSHTLTCTADAGNSDVYVYFNYPGYNYTPFVIITAGQGWPFTSFTLEPSYLVLGKWASVPVTAASYTPMDQGSWSVACIEIDPATNPNGVFYYSSWGGYIGQNSSKPGNYTLRLRLRSNHSVGCELPVRVVAEETPSSFQITYLHNGEYINDSERRGICNYGMGLSLGVITDPEDAYWNWADVELDPAYAEGFSFSGVGGRDDHPKLMRTTSNPSGTTSLNVQIKFRLKYDHSKTAYINIDHN
ncbi:MAG: Ig-like domain-containing protein [Bacteroidales bacterium]|nr:Ig-like domain-containing protein [Bacteroidales bacterium]